MAYFTINPSTGTGLTTVSATPVSQNLTYSARSSTVTITNGQTTKTVALTQGFLPHTVPSTENINIDANGGEISFEVLSDYIIGFSGYTSGDWCVIGNDGGPQPPVGSGSIMNWGIWPDELSTATLNVSVGANNTGSARTATIYMQHYYQDVSEIGKMPTEYVMHITQSTVAGHYLTIGNTLMEVNDMSSPMVSISSDVSWAVSSAPSFLDMLTTAGTGNGYIWFEPNSAAQQNEMQRGEIVVSDTQGLGLSQTLVVYYEGGGSTKGKYYISQTGFSHQSLYAYDSYAYDDVYIYYSTALTPTLTVERDNSKLAMYLQDRYSSYTPSASDYGNHLSLNKGVEYKLKIRVNLNSSLGTGDYYVTIEGSNNYTYGTILERITRAT